MQTEHDDDEADTGVAHRSLLQAPVDELLRALRAVGEVVRGGG